MTEKEMLKLKPGDLLYLHRKPYGPRDPIAEFETFGVVTKVEERVAGDRRTRYNGIQVLWQDYCHFGTVELHHSYTNLQDDVDDSMKHSVLVCAT